MNRPLFRAVTAPVKGSGKIACIMTGYRGKISTYDGVIQTLNKRGFTVVGYEHDPSAFTSGDPRDALRLMDELHRDFAERSAGYKKIICIGVSAGSGLGLGLQRRMPTIQYGVYAGAGEPGEAAIERPLLFLLRAKFFLRGFSADMVKNLWQDLDISPNNPPKKTVRFVMVLGKRDVLTRHKKALDALQTWQKAGVPIKIITRPNVGHIGVIKWHKEHIEELLDEAEQLS